MANEVLLEQVSFKTLTRSKTKTECEQRCGPVGTQVCANEDAE